MVVFQSTFEQSFEVVGINSSYRILLLEYQNKSIIVLDSFVSANDIVKILENDRIRIIGRRNTDRSIIKIDPYMEPYCSTWKFVGEISDEHGKLILNGKNTDAFAE